jgi:hypothetical protein
MGALQMETIALIDQCFRSKELVAAAFGHQVATKVICECFPDVSKTAFHTAFFENGQLLYSSFNYTPRVPWTMRVTVRGESVFFKCVTVGSDHMYKLSFPVKSFFATDDMNDIYTCLRSSAARTLAATLATFVCVDEEADMTVTF